MSGGRVGKDSEHPGRPQNEPLDDIILGDEETTEIPQAAAVDPTRAARSERPSRAAPADDSSRKSVRQKLLRIPDDEVSRPLHQQLEESAPPPPPPPPLKKPIPTFDPESTVKMNALDLDSSVQLPPMDSGPSLNEDSWTPLQPPVHPKTRPEPWNPRESDDDPRAAPNQPQDYGDRSQLPTPPPTSEEIPVAVDDPTSSDRIPHAHDMSARAADHDGPSTPRDQDGAEEIEPAPDSSPIGLTQRSEHPPARASGAPPNAALDGVATDGARDPHKDPLREVVCTVLDTGELQSIDVSFQSTPNLEVADPMGTPRAHPPTDPVPGSGSAADALELAADDFQPVDSKPPTAFAAASHQPHAPQAPQPPPLRPKTQSTPSVPPMPPAMAPMRPKAASGPPPAPPPMRPRSESTPSVPPHTSAPNMSAAPPVPPPMRPRSHSTPSVPPLTSAPMVPAAAAASVLGHPYTPPSPTPSNVSLSQTGQNSVAPKPPPPKAAARSQVVMVPSLLNSANGLAPPQIADAAHGRNKKVHPWWEDLFNDDYIRAMEKLTDSQIKREADFIEDSLGVAQGAMVLDLACGTGRHAIELSRRGYNVVGFDLSLAMLARAADEAAERAAQLNFVQGDMREMTFDEMFDGIYCWSTSFGFFEEEKNANVISRVHRALKKGGQFLLDVVNRDYVARQSPSLVWFEGDGAICMDEMQIDWITSRMKIKRTMMIDDGRSREIEFSMRLYALHELGKLLHDAGFRVAEISGRVATPGVFFGADSPRTIILAEKR